MKIRIMGKNWQFLRCGMIRKAWGYCDHPTTANKTIKVSSKAKGRLELDVIIHECFHAGFSDIKEESVDEFATDLARILWRLGYRKDEEES